MGISSYFFQLVDAATHETDDIIANMTLDGRVLTDIVCAVNRTAENTQHKLGSAGNSTDGDDSLFDKFWSQNGTVPFYLLFIFVPLLCIKNTKIFSYFNSMGQY